MLRKIMTLMMACTLVFIPILSLFLNYGGEIKLYGFERV